MTASQPNGRWLRRDLLLRLMLPLLIIVAATAAFGTYGAHRLMERVFDRWLLDAARSVTALVHFEHGLAHVDASPQTEAVLLFDDNDSTWYSVAQSGQLLSGQAGLPEMGDDEARYRHGSAFDATFEGHPVRVARTEVEDGGAPVIVLAAETLIKRQRAEKELVVFLWPMTILVLATAVSILWVVRRTVRPLEVIAARWNERSHVSLEPIGLDGVPRELMPFASALNDLLARIRAMLARERQFASTSAHQIRTPLAGLQLGLARAREAPDVNSMRMVIDELSEATQRTARLVQQLLAFGRLDPEARRELAFASCDLVAIAQDVGALYMDQAVAKSIHLELVAPDSSVTTQGQRELIAEALGNLIDNAIRYTPAGGTVVVELESSPPTVRVSDSGPGIPKDEREAIFERFVRGRSTHGDGVGLGLSIVRDIAALHGARVYLSDSACGGTAVELKFSTSPA
jgi:two-component system sensor histidine kinase TctE